MGESLKPRERRRRRRLRFQNHQAEVDLAFPKLSPNANSEDNHPNATVPAGRRTLDWQSIALSVGANRRQIGHLAARSRLGNNVGLGGASSVHGTIHKVGAPCLALSETWASLTFISMKFYSSLASNGRLDDSCGIALARWLPLPPQDGSQQTVTTQHRTYTFVVPMSRTPRDMGHPANPTHLLINLHFTD